MGAISTGFIVLASIIGTLSLILGIVLLVVFANGIKKKKRMNQPTAGNVVGVVLSILWILSTVGGIITCIVLGIVFGVASEYADDFGNLPTESFNYDYELTTAEQYTVDFGDLTADDTEDYDTEEYTDDYPDSNTDDDIPDDSGSGMGDMSDAVNNTLSDEVNDIFQSLDSDVNKITWSVLYSLSDDLPGIVISVYPFSMNGNNFVLVGITNLYEDEISINTTAHAFAYGGDDTNFIGSTKIEIPALGSGNTEVAVIDCGTDIPDGRIRWENFATNNSYADYTGWLADYKLSVSTNGSGSYVTYSIYSANNEPIKNGVVTIVSVDSFGNVTSFVTDTLDPLDPGAVHSSVLTLPVDGTNNIADVAIFANTTR